MHTAQGVNADTAHGLATGQESRQLLYTMLSRGAIGNHLYLGVVGDGDPHSVIHPTTVRPLTPTDILGSSLARDDAPRSATSLLTEQADPAIRLGDATQRYLDSLYLAAEQTVGADVVAALDEAVDRLLPGLSDEAAWPPLRAHLLLLGANGENPVQALQAAASDRELHSADDRAAVLDWRLDASGRRNAGTGPLPWVPGVPAGVRDDAHWGAYLTQRAQLVADLAGQVREHASTETALPAWAQNGIRPHDPTLADVEVWRAAMQVVPEDRRPTGPPQLQKAAATWQRRLNGRITGDHTPALKEWRHLLDALAPQVRDDDFTPLLAERMAAMSRAGIHAHQLLHNAVEASPLPDEHAAAALWWRMARHLTPAVAAQIDDQNVTTTWTPHLADLLGTDRADRIQASTWWPALVANIDHGLQRGWRLEELLGAGAALPTDDVDECQALVWRTSIALEPVPDEYADVPYEEPPEDMWKGVDPPAEAVVDDVDQAPYNAPAAAHEPPDAVDVELPDVNEGDDLVERATS